MLPSSLFYERPKRAESSRSVRSRVNTPNFSSTRWDRTRAAERYLRMVSGSLLNEHYIDNELRIDYLRDRITKNLEIDEAIRGFQG
jgi:hypothetical protein